MELTEELLRTHLREKARADTSAIEATTPLFSSGLVDSFSMVDLIAFIELTDGIRMAPLDVNLDNLDSIEKILRYVQQATDSKQR